MITWKSGPRYVNRKNKTIKKKIELSENVNNNVGFDEILEILMGVEVLLDTHRLVIKFNHLQCTIYQFKLLIHVSIMLKYVVIILLCNAVSFSNKPHQ